MRRRHALLLGALAFVASACAGGLAPRGPEAARLADLFWLMVGMSTFVGVLVLGILLAAILRRPGHAPGDERALRRRFVLAGGIVLPAVLLSVLMVFNVGAMLAGATTAELAIEVTGHRYWWEVGYDDFTTANEIHIPTGTPVTLSLTADDVIHSVWVPELAGKRDMVPGRTNELVLEADEPGRYVGRCAEYCGLQHAWMLFTVVAHEPAEYEGWYAAHADDAPEPTTPAQERGRDVFLDNSCVGCHAIRGVAGQGEVGPDLTHLASREQLGAGILPNTPQDLAAWIANPQAIKPGVEMPPQELAAEDLDALVAYLESLE